MENCGLLEEGLIVHERRIPANGTEILIRTYIPESGDSPNKRFPLIVWLHGAVDLTTRQSQCCVIIVARWWILRREPGHK